MAAPTKRGCTYTALSLVAEELNTAGIDTEIPPCWRAAGGRLHRMRRLRRRQRLRLWWRGERSLREGKRPPTALFWQPGPLRLCCRQHGQLYGPPGLRWRQAPGLHKPAAICASARRAGTTATLDQLVKYPEFFHMPLVKVALTGPWSTAPTRSRCSRMRKAAPLCGSWAATWPGCCTASRPGRDAGFNHPQNPPRPRTGFIR